MLVFETSSFVAFFDTFHRQISALTRTQNNQYWVPGTDKCQNLKFLWIITAFDVFKSYDRESISLEKLGQPNSFSLFHISESSPADFLGTFVEKWCQKHVIKTPAILGGSYMSLSIMHF